jgi:hypothetical protein
MLRFQLLADELGDILYPVLQALQRSGVGTVWPVSGSSVVRLMYAVLSAGAPGGVFLLGSLPQAAAASQLASISDSITRIAETLEAEKCK